MTKKNIILAIVLVILGALAYGYQGPWQEWRKKIDQPKNFLAALPVDQLTKIEVKKGDKTTVLEKSGERWKIGGTKDFYVDNALSQNMIDELKAAAKANLEVISENKDKKSLFATDDNGINVKLFKGEAIVAVFIVGKMASDYQSTYISQPNLDKTYQVKAGLNAVFDRASWYDYTIFSSDQTKITKIRFQYPAREFTIEKKDDKWAGTLPQPFTVNKEKAEAIAGIMANLVAADIPEQTYAGTGLEKHLIIVQATGEGVDNTLMIGNANKDGEYYVKKGNSDNIYLISKEQQNTLNTDINKLK